MLTDVRLACAVTCALAGLRALGWRVPPALLLASAVTAVLGLITLMAFIMHVIPTIFNCKVPWQSPQALLSLFYITKPLELVWRLATAPLRDLPDVLVLGAPRCGTTTLAAHLRTAPGAQPPFWYVY